MESYKQRLYKAIDYINSNLSQELSLDLIASAAAFSTYHFHRIFSATLGESLWNYTVRLRLEKAAQLLTSTNIISITQIALDTGFSSSSVFSRAFKNYFGISPSNWKKNKSKICKVGIPEIDYIEGRTRVLKIQERFVAYSASFKGYDDRSLKMAGKILFSWALKSNLLKEDSVILGIGFDNPEITKKSLCRYYVCLQVPEGTTGNDSIGFLTIPGGEYAVISFRGRKKELASVYNYLYGKWLPESSYLPGDSASYEIYKSDPNKSPDGTLDLDIYVPLKKF
ncbi:MAG: AraC family transcriptional regulator [Spirochaetales bacterium]|nr:AraC family transcriptional regulator [Spirochaetales bacterium]